MAERKQVKVLKKKQMFFKFFSSHRHNSTWNQISFLQNAAFLVRKLKLPTATSSERVRWTLSTTIPKNYITLIFHTNNF